MDFAEITRQTSPEIARSLQQEDCCNAHIDGEQLKGCPHCGGAAYLNSNFSYKAHSYFVYVKCIICGAQGRIYNSDDDPAAVGWNNQPCRDAAAAWNMRTSERGQTD